MSQWSWWLPTLSAREATIPPLVQKLLLFSASEWQWVSTSQKEIRFQMPGDYNFQPSPKWLASKFKLWDVWAQVPPLKHVLVLASYKGIAIWWQIPLQEYSPSVDPAVPAQHTFLTSPQDSERTRGLCTCWDPAPNDICWCFTQAFAWGGQKKKFRILWFFTVGPSVFVDWVSGRPNMQFLRLFWWRNLFSRSILQDWCYIECMLGNDVSFKG